MTVAIRVLLAIAVALAAAALSIGAAHADPDPHIPNPQTGYCPGGGYGGYLGYCDGIKYPDGSYWHYIQYAVPGDSPFLESDEPEGLLMPEMRCVVENGLIPDPAPPGGCGGAVK
jgi:hypothetical protein